MKKFSATIHYSREIFAEDEDAAAQIFWEDMEQSNQTPLTTLEDRLVIKEIKSDEIPILDQEIGEL